MKSRAERKQIKRERNRLIASRIGLGEWFSAGGLLIGLSIGVFTFGDNYLLMFGFGIVIALVAGTIGDFIDGKRNK